jgi:prepilin-type N-terminal cleavage/methylation domain-containing protein
MLKHTKKKAFTLLELIAVVVVLSILAALAIPTFSTVKQSAADKVAYRSAENVVRNAEVLAAVDGAALNDTYLDTAGAETDGYNGTANTITISSGGMTAVATIDATTGAITVGAGSGNGGSTVSTYFTTPSHTNQSHWTFENSGGTVTAVRYNSTVGSLAITWSGSSADVGNGYNIYLFTTANPGPLNGANAGSVITPASYDWQGSGWAAANKATDNGNGTVTFTVTHPSLVAGSGSGLITAVVRNHMYNPATPLIRFVE